jgi:hypothetical protein
MRAAQTEGTGHCAAQTIDPMLRPMRRLDYQKVADSIVAADTEGERSDAKQLVAAYYSVEPLPESCGERIRTLLASLRRQVAA